MISPYKCVVVADGLFPSDPRILEYLYRAGTVIACDGAIESFTGIDLIPDAIVGDMDSIPENLRLRFADRLHPNNDVEINDLTKAILYAKNSGHKEVLILGATGLREDHTLGNISLLIEYALLFDRVEMVSDYGLFTPVLRTTTFSSHPGQQVSFFSMQPCGTVTTHNLRYPLHNKNLTAWWQGTLNEALDSEFTLTLSPDARMIVFRKLGWKQCD